MLSDPTHGMNLISNLNQPFLDAGSDLANALLYLDAGAGEALHINLGLKALAGLGVPHAFGLEAAGLLDTDVFSLLTGMQPRKLVIITTQLLTATHSSVLRAMQAHQDLSSCTILCSVSEEAHAAMQSTELSLGEDAYLDYENALKEDLAEMQSRTGIHLPASLTVKYFPLQVCNLTNSAFVLPAASSAAAMSSWSAVRLGVSTTEMLQQSQDAHPAGKQTKFKVLAHALVGLAAALDCKVETFSLGPSANALGDEVCSLLPPEMPGGRVPRQTAALVLVDHRLDLHTATHHSEHVLDRIFGCLPRRNASQPARQSEACLRSADVVVPPAENETPSTDATAPIAPAGSLFPVSHSGAADAGQWLQVLLGRQGREAALYLRKWLKEALRKEGLQPKGRFKPGTVTPAEIDSLLEVLTGSPVAAIKQRCLIQLASAAAAAMRGEEAVRWEAISKQERQLAMVSSEGAESLALALEDLLKSASGSSILRLRDILLLAIQAYSLAAAAVWASGLGLRSTEPVFTAEQTRNLKSALIAAMHQAPIDEADSWLGELGPRLVQQRQKSGQGASTSFRQYEETALKLEMEDKAGNILAKLEEVSSVRQRLPGLQRLLAAGKSEDGATPLLHSLVTAILQGQAIPDLQHHSASLRNLLNTGLGRFGLKQKQPSPSDHPKVILFLVGGVSIADLRAVNAALEAPASADPLYRPGIIVGGTSLLAPADVLNQLFSTD